MQIRREIKRRSSVHDGQKGLRVMQIRREIKQAFRMWHLARV